MEPEKIYELISPFGCCTGQYADNKTGTQEKNTASTILRSFIHQMPEPGTEIPEGLQGRASVMMSCQNSRNKKMQEWLNVTDMGGSVRVTVEEISKGNPPYKRSVDIGYDEFECMCRLACRLADIRFLSVIFSNSPESMAALMKQSTELLKEMGLMNGVPTCCETSVYADIGILIAKERAENTAYRRELYFPRWHSFRYVLENMLAWDKKD